MLKFAIVEDEAVAANVLAEHLRRFAKENDEVIEYAVFDNAYKFLDKYNPSFDVVLMDIEMPGINGIDAARELRKTDENVPLIFITNMQQYAIQGYEVNALHFILKPVSYCDFKTVIKKVIRSLREREGKEITIRNAEGLWRLSTSAIRFIEVNRHKLTFHLEDKIIEGTGNLYGMEKDLASAGFARCHLGYLVNMRYVKGVTGDDVIIDSEKLKISKSKKREFLTSLAAYLGGNNAGNV